MAWCLTDPKPGDIGRTPRGAGGLSWGYDGAGHGVRTPVKQPPKGKRLAVANQTINRMLRGLRWQGERGYAILIGR